MGTPRSILHEAELTTDELLALLSVPPPSTAVANIANVSFAVCYTPMKRKGNSAVALRLSLIPADFKLEVNSDGAAFDISSSETRTFLCVLKITEQIEQESLDVSIWGSANGQDFGKRPLLMIPQQFYCGSTKMVLDISLRPEVRFLRAKWEVNRWGRVAPTPMFVAGLEIQEIPPMAEDTTTRRAVQVSSAR